jgi:hypothetical protein
LNTDAILNRDCFCVAKRCVGRGPSQSPTLAAGVNQVRRVREPARREASRVFFLR